MKGLPYLTALLLLVPLLVVAPSAGAQVEEEVGGFSEEARGDVSSSIVLSGNGSTVTDSFDLGSGLAIVVVCTNGGDDAADDGDGEGADPEPEMGAGDEVDAGPGEAVARAGGVVARAGGDGDGSDDGDGQASQASSSEQTESRTDVDCDVTSGGEAGRGEASCTTTTQGNVECVEEEETEPGDSDVSVGLIDEDGGATRAGEEPDNRTVSANRTTRLLTSSSQAAGTDGGRHALAVRAKGPWTVKVEQPRPTDAPPAPASFSSDRETATGFFRMSRGTKDFEVTHRGEGRFTVRLLDENGAKVGRSLAKEKGPFRGSRSVRVPKDGIYLLQVEADGPWTVRRR